MTFEYLGIKVEVCFEMSIIGRHSYDTGDYYTPSYSDCTIDSIEVDITNITIDDYEVELTKDITEILEKVIKEKI